MNALILAGGRGSRLRPLTNSTPKPMLTAGGRPIIDYCVSHLYHYGIRDMVFTLGYLPEQIVEWAIGYTGISTHFLIEDLPLGTLGSVKAAKEYLDDIFIVISGDGITDINLNKMIAAHLKSGALLTAAVKECEDPTLYGVAVLDEGGFIKDFVEKPHSVTSKAYINCGVYIIDKRAIDFVNAENCDFARDLFPLLLKQNKLAYYIHSGYWKDIGDIKSYFEANFDLFEKSFFPLVKNFRSKEYGSKFLGSLKPSLVSDSATILGDIENCVIGRKAKIAEGSILHSCVVLDNASVHGEHFGEIIF